MQGLLIFGYLNLKSRISFLKITYQPFFKTFSLFSIINRLFLIFMVAKGWLFDVNLYFLHLNAQDVIIFELWFFLKKFTFQIPHFSARGGLFVYIFLFYFGLILVKILVNLNYPKVYSNSQNCRLFSS